MRQIKPFGYLPKAPCSKTKFGWNTLYILKNCLRIVNLVHNKGNDEKLWVSVIETKKSFLVNQFTKSDECDVNSGLINKQYQKNLTSWLLKTQGISQKYLYPKKHILFILLRGRKYYFKHKRYYWNGNIWNSDENIFVSSFVSCRLLWMDQVSKNNNKILTNKKDFRFYHNLLLSNSDEPSRQDLRVLKQYCWQ